MTKVFDDLSISQRVSGRKLIIFIGVIIITRLFIPSLRRSYDTI